MEPIDICGVPYNDYLIQMEEFHGTRSPGMLLGGLMVDRAIQEMKATTPFLNVVCETVVCLPDAVQLLTPCTFGNGFMQVLDWGKFALTVYDRETLLGIRVMVDLDKLPNYPLILNWFQRTGRPREKPPFEDLSAQILSGRDHIITHRPVRITRPLKEEIPVPTGRCPECGESYPLHLGPRCPGCNGEAYYDYKPSQGK